MEPTQLMNDDESVRLAAPAAAFAAFDNPPAQSNSTAQTEAPGRRKVIDVREDDSGVLFINVDGSLGGAMRFGGEVFQCSVRALKSAGGSTYWVVSGTGNRGDGLTGLLFNERGGPTNSGALRPKLTGRVATVAGRDSRRIAGWVRASTRTPFYSLRLTTSRDPDATPELPFEWPAQPSQAR